MGGAVSWAGNEPMPVWFDVAREYTERWHHQQQIRDATGRPGLYGRHLFEPVLDTFVRGLPHTFRDEEAKDGTAVGLALTGVLEKEWVLVRGGGKWELFEGDGTHASPHDAEVTVAAEKVWKIFTRGIRGAEAMACAEIRGDRGLGEKALEMVSVIA